jgi:hypothetical protein
MGQRNIRIIARLVGGRSAPAHCACGAVDVPRARRAGVIRIDGRAVSVNSLCDECRQQIEQICRLKSGRARFSISALR